MDKTLRIILIVSALIIAILVLYFFVLRKLILKIKSENNFQEVCCKTIYNIALNRDLYLVNALTLAINEETSLHIDHLLLGEKYIYVIVDRYYKFPIEGNADDNSFALLYPREKKVIDNPILMNQQRLEKLSLLTQINKKFLISIVVVNDDALINKINTNSNSSYICKYSEVTKLINALEERNVMPIDDTQLKYAAKQIARLGKKE